VLLSFALSSPPARGKHFYLFYFSAFSTDKMNNFCFFGLLKGRLGIIQSRYTHLVKKSWLFRALLCIVTNSYQE
jgi:hypothetical protein